MYITGFCISLIKCLCCSRTKIEKEIPYQVFFPVWGASKEGGGGGGGVGELGQNP